MSLHLFIHSIDPVGFFLLSWNGYYAPDLRLTYLSGRRGCVYYYFRHDREAKTAERFNQSIENIDSTLLSYFCRN